MVSELARSVSERGELVLRRRYDERVLEWRPYLYRWLGGSGTSTLEQRQIEAGTLPPLGYRYVGVARSG